MITDWKGLGEVTRQKISDQINDMDNVAKPKEVLERKSVANTKKKVMVNVSNQRRDNFRLGSLYSQSSVNLKNTIRPPPKKMLRK